jgi:hypothetical protein
MNFLLTMLPVALILLLVVAGFLILSNSRSGRTRSIKQLSRSHSGEFSSFDVLPNRLRSKSFRIFAAGQMRYIKNFWFRPQWSIQGQDADLAAQQFSESSHGKSREGLVYSFDYEFSSPKGMQTQTIIAVNECLFQCGDFSLIRRPEILSDSFSEPLNPVIRPCGTERLLEIYRDYLLYARTPFDLEPKLNRDVAKWMEAHPDVCIEYREDTLLIYKMGTLIEPEQLLSAQVQAKALIKCLGDY